MKVLFYSPFILRLHHFATEMELAIKHQKKGDDVHFLLCDTSLRTCQKNVHHLANICTECVIKRDNSLAWLEIPYENRHFLNLESYQSNIEVPYFNNIEEVKNFEVEGTDIGFASASSLISDLRETYPDLDKYRKLVEKYIKTSVSLYQAGIDILKKIKPDLIYLFNGRYVIVRPVFRAAQYLDIDVLIYENPGKVNQYCLWENTLPHDLNYVKSRIQIAWEDNKNEKEKIKLANNWFNDNKSRDNKLTDIFMFVQKEGSLPSNIDIHKDKRIITIFISSEYEFSAIDKIWLQRFYKDQNEVVEKLLTKVKNEDIYFYIRIHPNLKGHDNTQTRFLKKFKADNVTVIFPEEDIDSYSLIDISEKIITFGSTIGLEATYWGKPSICLGRSYYEDLNVSYHVNSYEELYKMVLKKGLKTLSKEGTLKYAYWSISLGINYQFYKPDINKGSINRSSLIKLKNKEFQINQINDKSIINIKHNLPKIFSDFYQKNLFGKSWENKYHFAFIINDYKNNLGAVKSLLETKSSNLSIVLITSHFDLNDIKLKFSNSPNFSKKIKVIFETDDNKKDLITAVESIEADYYSIVNDISYYFKNSLDNLIYEIASLVEDFDCFYSNYVLWEYRKGLYHFQYNEASKPIDSVNDNIDYTKLNLYSDHNLIDTFFTKKEVLLESLTKVEINQLSDYIIENTKYKEIDNPLFLKMY